jgi:hypothetical protein
MQESKSKRIRDRKRLFRKYNPSLASKGSLSPTTPVGAVVAI